MAQEEKKAGPVGVGSALTKTESEDGPEPGHLDDDVSFRRLLVGWIIGLLVLAGLVSAILHFGDVSVFMSAFRSADRYWLLAAAVIQLMTYVCAAATWAVTLSRARSGRPIASLLPLAVIELFVNQAVPTGGLSGSVMVVRGLVGRGISSALATTALLMAALSYYAAYFLVACAAVVLLWRRGDLTDSWLLLTLAFFVTIGLLAGLVMLAVWSRGRFVPMFMRQWPPAARLAKLFALVRIDIIRDAHVLLATIGLQGAIFLLDSATLWCVGRAVGANVDTSAAFISFVLASIVATLAPIPLGLGSFEGTCVAMLHMMGIGVEAALVATLILRGLTFWLPMLPGLWLIHAEAGSLFKSRSRKLQP